MKIEVDGFEFDFQDAINAFIFDEKDKSSPTYHGLSHAMKAVDLIVELENDYLFIEVKDFHEPGKYQEGNRFNHLRDVLKYKYRDSFLYRWAEQKTDKPIRYLCLLTLDNALVSRMNKEIRLQIPSGTSVERWQRAIAKSSAVLNVERWNRNFPKWPVNLVMAGRNFVSA
ncbi:hypothetical protein QUF76_03025 [Desulfobacterales bacterium HSG16]|nr:hypothetical protein [Desulfobacterales bacterium HSG16]